MPGEVVAVAEPVAHQYVHHAERQRRVGADANRQMPVGALRRLAAPRLDDDEGHAGPAHLVGERPEMDIGGDEIGAPGDDQIAVDHRLGIGAADRADGQVPRRLAAGVAHRAGDQPARAQRMKQAEHQAAV